MYIENASLCVHAREENLFTVVSSVLLSLLLLLTQYGVKWQPFFLSSSPAAAVRQKKSKTKRSKSPPQTVGTVGLLAHTIQAGTNTWDPRGTSWRGPNRRRRHSSLSPVVKTIWHRYKPRTNPTGPRSPLTRACGVCSIYHTTLRFIPAACQTDDSGDFLRHDTRDEWFRAQRLTQNKGHRPVWLENYICLLYVRMILP